MGPSGDHFLKKIRARGNFFSEAKISNTKKIRTSLANYATIG